MQTHLTGRESFVKQKILTQQQLTARMSFITVSLDSDETDRKGAEPTELTKRRGAGATDQIGFTLEAACFAVLNTSTCAAWPSRRIARSRKGTAVRLARKPVDVPRDASSVNQARGGGTQRNAVATRCSKAPGTAGERLDGRLHPTVLCRGRGEVWGFSSQCGTPV